jgi:hypothetical protein
VPLAFNYRSKLIDALGTIRCNGQLALPTAYLLGTGPDLALLPAWSTGYASASASVKIYTQPSDPGIDNIVAGLLLYPPSSPGSPSDIN